LTEQTTDRAATPLHQTATNRRHEKRLSASSAGKPAEPFAQNDTLEQFLGGTASSGVNQQAVAVLVQMLAKAAVQIADAIALGYAGGASRNIDEAVEAHNSELHKRLEMAASTAFHAAIRRAPVAAVLSEDFPEALLLDPAGSLAVAIDPLDGSSNIDANVAIGTIFAVYPAREDVSLASEHFLRAGHEQIAAGFFIYGPQTCFVLSVGDGVHIFMLDRRSEMFRLAISQLAMREETNEYAVNASNYRHWDNSIRAYIDDCIRGTDGPLRLDHNMRWIASFVADAYRILVRGGVFLDPGDHRREHAEGRPRLMYEANPIAFLVEQAGGAATDTEKRILDIQPSRLDARTPIVFGSSATVERITKYHADPQFSAERAPLFFQRGLIRR
jgi:fructose-1,6-bisphosphatase I